LPDALVKVSEVKAVTTAVSAGSLGIFATHGSVYKIPAVVTLYRLPELL
jgi:hypothetical protein